MRKWESLYVANNETCKTSSQKYKLEPRMKNKNQTVSHCSADLDHYSVKKKSAQVQLV